MFVCSTAVVMRWPMLLLALLLVVCSQGLLAQTLKVQGTFLVNDRGAKVRLQGINWFGFNNKQTMVDGLWAGSDSPVVDFSTIIFRFQILGFNAVRLPFSFKDFKLPPKPFARSCAVKTKDEILALTTAPNAAPRWWAQPTAHTPNPPTISGGMCNQDVVGGTTYARFLWVVKKFAQAGMYVMPDNHVRTDEDMSVHENPDNWIKSWEKLVKDLVKDPVVKARLIVDLINEPDNTGCTWEDRTENGVLKRGLTYVYLGAMAKIYKASPSTLILIEGTGGRDTIVPGTKAVPYWGGFPTDPALIKAAGLSDARPFFKALLTKPYVNNVVLSFHAYTTAVIPWQVPMNQWVGKGLTKRYTETFGYLTKKGFCTIGKCRVFPFIIGEFAAPRAGNARDSLESTSFADYFSLKGDGKDGLHTRMDNWFFWAWNANSGDTGGIAASNWLTIDWAKVQFLEQRYSLVPWYRKS